MPKRPNGPFFADKCVPRPRAVRPPRPHLPTAPQWQGTHNERRRGYVNMRVHERRAGDGRVRSIAAVLIGFFLIRQSKKTPVGHRAADHELPAVPQCLPAPRKPTSRHAAARLTSTSKRALLPECQGAFRSWLGRIADDGCEGQRRNLVAPVALSCPLRCKTPCLKAPCLTSDGQQQTSRPPPSARRRSYRPVERRSPSRNISCLCNQLEFVRYSAGCYVRSLIAA
jgi:hypothetical protein